MHTYQTNVPAALDGLVAVVKAAVAAAEWASKSPIVHDGVWTSMETNDVIAVGWEGELPGYQRPTQAFSDDQGTPGVDVTTTQQGLGPTLLETIVIHCGILCRMGDSEIGPARRRAFSYQQVIGQAVTQRPYLNGAVQKLTFAASHNTRQAKDRMGALVVLPFSIECMAFAQ